MIGAAAVAILQEGDARQLTISSVAKRLGVRSQSLYHHIRSVSEIVDAARAVLIAEIDLECLDTAVPLADGLTEFALRYADVFQPLADNIWEFFRHPIQDPTTIAMYERLLCRALAEDLSDERALTLVLDVEYAIFMGVFEHASLQTMLDPDQLREHGAETLARVIRGSGSATPQGLRVRLSERIRELVSHALSTSRQ